MFLISAVDVEIELRFDVFGKQIVHHPDWTATPAVTFLEEIFAEFGDDNEKDVWRLAHAAHLDNLTDKNGKRYGRAALTMYSMRRPQPWGGYSIGGFLTLNNRSWFVGAIDGDTQDATRQKAELAAPREVLANWASNQANLIDQSRFNYTELLQAAENIRLLGGNPGNLPIAFAGGKLISLEALHALAKSNVRLHLFLTEGYREKLQLTPIGTMRASNIDYSIREDVIALDWNLPANELFPDEESSKKIVRSGGAHIKLEDIGPVRPQIDRAIRILQGVWSEPIDLSIERIQVRQVNFYRPPALDWVLTMTHRSTIASS